MYASVWNILQLVNIDVNIIGQIHAQANKNESNGIRPRMNLPHYMYMRVVFFFFFLALWYILLCYIIGYSTLNSSKANMPEEGRKKATGTSSRLI